MARKNNPIVKIILKLLLLIAIIVTIAVGTYFILRLCGFTTVEDFTNLRDKIGDNIWFWLIIVALQIIQVVFIPISNQIISVPIAIIFKEELWKVFLASWVGIEIGTIILYFIGRYGGEKILNWVLGDKEKTEKCKKFMTKGKAFYMIGMVIAVIPDDILTTLAGTSKYKFSYVLTVSSVARAICVAASVWGFGYLTQFWWGWVILGVGVILIGLATWLLLRYQKKKEQQELEKENAEKCPYFIDIEK